jgi:hypothetical protein
MKELEALQTRIDQLEAKCQTLELKLREATSHKTVFAGVKGELLIAGLSGGVVVSGNRAFDVVAGTTKFEVKYAALSKPIRNSEFTRWQWAKLLGEKNSKTYDYLVLIGEKDARYNEKYKFVEEEFCYFMVPIKDVPLICGKGTRGSMNLLLSANPDTKSESKQEIWQRYVVLGAAIEDFLKKSTEDLSQLP